MSALLAPVAIQQFKDSSGNPLIGGQLYTYQAGTSIPAPSYTDATGTSANTNPVILNSRGEAPIWLTPGQFYKLVLLDASSVLIWSADQVPGGFIDAALLPNTTSSNLVRSDFSASSGSSLVGFLQSGAGAVARNLQNKVRESVSAFDYMTPAQIASVIARDLNVTVGAALTAAISSAQVLGAELYMPAGTYNVNDGVTGSNWAGARIRGAGTNNTILRKTTAGDMLTFTGFSRGCIRDMAMDGTGMTYGNGLVLTGTGSGVMDISGNQFANFPARGLYANFVAPGSSSNSFDRNLFLSNGNISNVPQAEYRYVQDSQWSRNQYGANGLSGPRAPSGAYHYSCQAGDYGPSNYHWENLVGAIYENCDFTRFFSNRWETNQHEGVKFINTLRCSFVGNHIQSNSMASTGTYDGMTMDTCARWAITGNKYYTFNAFQMATCLRITTNCNGLIIVGNEFFDFAGTVPVVWDIGSQDINLYGNLPSGYGLEQSWSFQVHGKARAVPATQTVFAGQGAQSFSVSDVIYVISRKCNAVLMRVNVSTSPGTGQAIICTLQKNGVDTTFTVAITDSMFTNVSSGMVAFLASDTWNWKIVSSAGAATSTITINTAFDA